MAPLMRTMRAIFTITRAHRNLRQHIPNGAEVVNVVQARHLAGVMEGMPRGIRGIMGLSWPKEKLAIEAENQVVQEQINSLEAEQATQLAKLGEMQLTLQKARTDLSSIQNRLKKQEQKRKTEDLDRIEALAAAEEQYTRTVNQLKTLQELLSEVRDLATNGACTEIEPSTSLHCTRREDLSGMNAVPGSSDHFEINRAIQAKESTGISSSPISLGGRHFKDFDEIWRYCSNLLKHTVEGSRLGSKDEAVVMELLTVGHPEYTRKMLLTSSGTGGADPEQIQVRSEGTIHPGKAFTLIKSDGTTMNFSFRRCIAGLKKMEKQ